MVPNTEAKKVYSLYLIVLLLYVDHSQLLSKETDSSFKSLLCQKCRKRTFKSFKYITETIAPRCLGCLEKTTTTSTKARYIRKESII